MSVISFVGKGGVGKTTLAALLLDEIARRGFTGPALAVDADPAMTLAMTLGLPEPATTIAQIKETTRLDAAALHRLPPGMTPAELIRQRFDEMAVVVTGQLRRMPLYLLAMGRSEGPGCYCGVNRALATTLSELAAAFPLVVIDNEAGLEHLSRCRLKRADFLLAVVTPQPASQRVGQTLLDTANTAGLEIGETWVLHNRAEKRGKLLGRPTLVVPSMPRLEQTDWPAPQAVSDDSPLRLALRPIVESALAEVG
jgi:CO dehydrogenase maturation factor